MITQAEQIGALARAALEREARLSPKPGLVDAQSCGAHTDMDLSLLLRSAEVLEPYFALFTARGMEQAHLPPKGRISAIRADGRAAEEAMFAATNGVNTHKGALFLLGVLCYAAGHCAGNGVPLLPETICQTAARVCSGITRELGADAGRAYASFGARGARGEAEDGFPNALLALEQLKIAKAQGAGENDAWLLALLHLIETLEDANVLARCGKDVAKELRIRAGEVATRHPAGGTELAHEICALGAECRLWRASPGGAADVLACAMFLHALTLPSVIDPPV
ncbi:MAG TPA: triphosphoribosyl-dephospho-CoA synthase [Clostridia bacterium]|nr:triphosphoribosyl-dephospho-CoA synthase [Clostridia bacterium]